MHRRRLALIGASLTAACSCGGDPLRSVGVNEAYTLRGHGFAKRSHMTDFMPAPHACVKAEGPEVCGPACVHSRLYVTTVCSDFERHAVTFLANHHLAFPRS